MQDHLSCIDCQIMYRAFAVLYAKKTSTTIKMMEMKWMTNRQAVDSPSVSWTKNAGNFVAYCIFRLELQFVRTPSEFGLRLQSFSSNFLLKHNLISYKYCSSLCSSFKQKISGLAFSWLLMALWISIASTGWPGWIFAADNNLCIAYWSCHRRPCSKYFNGVLSSWIEVPHFPCLFHWCFQNVSSRDPMELNILVKNSNHTQNMMWLEYPCKCLANVGSSDRWLIPLHPFGLAAHFGSCRDQKSRSLMAKHHEWPRNLAVLAECIHFHRSLSSNLCKRWWAMIEKISRNQSHLCLRCTSLCYVQISKRKWRNMRIKTTNDKVNSIQLKFLFTH